MNEGKHRMSFPKKMMNFMLRILNKFTATCDVITEKISESLDHRLSISDRLKIRIHIMFCKFCRRYHHQLLMMHRFFEDRLQREEQNSLPTGSELSSEAKNKMKQKLKNNQ